MFKSSIQTIIVGTLQLFLLATVCAQPPVDPNQIIREIDQNRLPKESFEAFVKITPIKASVEQEPGRYSVKSNGQGQVLVEALDRAQQGDKYLTTASGLFFFSPRTKRAIRLTPLQTLIGQASVGDIARISFSVDYDAVLGAPVTSCAQPDCLVLDLASKNESSTYNRIVLLVKRSGNRYNPVGASLYLASGKLIKSVEFGTPILGLPPPARYRDAVNGGLETMVVYESVKAAKFPPNLFNPRILEQ